MEEIFTLDTVQWEENQLERLNGGFSPSPTTYICPTCLLESGMSEDSLKQELKKGTNIGNLWLQRIGNSECLSSKSCLGKKYIVSLQEAQQPLSTYGRKRPQSPEPDLNWETDLSIETQQKTGSPYVPWQDRAISRILTSLEMYTSDTTTPCDRSQKIIPDLECEAPKKSMYFGVSPRQARRDGYSRRLENSPITSRLRRRNGGMLTKERRSSSLMNSEGLSMSPTYYGGWIDTLAQSKSKGHKFL